MAKPTYEFEQNFDTNTFIATTLGRLQFEDGSVIRLVFTPEGMKALISRPKNSTYILISDFEEGEVFASFGSKY